MPPIVSLHACHYCALYQRDGNAIQCCSVSNLQWVIREQPKSRSQIVSPNTFHIGYWMGEYPSPQQCTYICQTWNFALNDWMGLMYKLTPPPNPKQFVLKLMSEATYTGRTQLFPGTFHAKLLTRQNLTSFSFNPPAHLPNLSPNTWLTFCRK